MSIEKKVHYCYQQICTVHGVEANIPACRIRSKVTGILLTRDVTKITCLRCKLKFTGEGKTPV